MRTWVALCIMVLVCGTLTVEGCGKKAGRTLAEETVEWFQGVNYGGSYISPDNPELLSRVAAIASDEAAMSHYLNMLRGATKDTPRSHAVVVFARHLKDKESVQVLRDVLLEADDPIRTEALITLNCRCRIPGEIGLDSAMVMKVMDLSNDMGVRGMAVGLAERDSDYGAMCRKALAYGVKSSVFIGLEPGHWERRMAKEWLRGRAAELDKTDSTDLLNCEEYLKKAYGLKPTREIEGGNPPGPYARRIINLADQIDAFTDKAQQTAPE